MSEQYRAMVWRMASAVLVQMNGLGSSLWASMKAAMSDFSLLDAAMNAALDLFVGEQREPAFDLVQPGSAGRREVQVIARVAGQPGPDRRRLVGGVIVEHQVDVETGRHGGFDRGEEAAEFDRAVALVAAADDPAGGDVERGEQRGGAVTRIIVAAPLDLSGPHRQQRLGAVERPGSAISHRRTAPVHGRAG